MDEDESSALFYQYKSNRSLNKYHVAHELKPSVTACPKAVSVSAPGLRSFALTEEVLAVTEPKRFCKGCVLARPGRFPDSILKHFVGR